MRCVLLRLPIVARLVVQGMTTVSVAVARPVRGVCLSCVLDLTAGRPRNVVLVTACGIDRSSADAFRR